MPNNIIETLVQDQRVLSDGQLLSYDGTRDRLVGIPPISTDPLMGSLGLLSWNMTPHAIAGATAPTSQTLYALALPTTAGVQYTGVKLNIGTAGTSTAPTNFFVGLATQAAIGSKGTMLAQSADLAGSASLTIAGQQSFVFSAPYIETTSAIRIVLIVMNGAFGGTNVTLSRSASSNTWNQGSGTPAFVVTAGTAVTALAANGAQLAGIYSGSGTLDYWVGLY